jgi:hypothetical protein
MRTLARTRNSNSLKEKNQMKQFMGIALAFGLFTTFGAAAYAESIAVPVPFAFSAGGKVFPAGTYTMETMASGVLLIPAESADMSAIGKTGSSLPIAAAVAVTR